ncbi:MAG TPA: hypothetical protein VK889_10820 [Solirubrobacterales bacterium]|nr:hypothetical protein [Solirubrobacterales bacterium]
MKRLLLSVALLLGLVFPSSALATPLSPFIDLQEKGLTMTDDAVGLEGLGSGTRSFSVNVGGSVRFALLYWAGRDLPCPPGPGGCTLTQPYKDQQMIFNGTPLTGTVIGTESQAATENGAVNNIGYFADVTSLVAAAGAGVRTFTIGDGNLASNLFRLDGASLVVAYTDPASTVFYRVQVFDNLDFAFGNDLIPGDTRETAPVTFNHGAVPFARIGALTIIAGDATEAGSDRISVSGHADVVGCLDASAGSRWDADTIPIYLSAGTASTSTRIFSDPGPNPDSLLWTMAMLRVPVDAPGTAPVNDCLPRPQPVVSPSPPSSPPSFDPAPALSALRVNPRAFVPGGGRATASATGAKISYASSEVAAVAFRVERVVKGTLLKGVCVKRIAATAKGKSCSRFISLAGGFSHQAQAGTNSLPFSGRLGKRKLAVGRYRLVATATDAAGQNSQPASTRFRIKPVPRAGGD